MLCNYSLEKGFIIKDFKKFRITSKGEKFIDDTNRTLNRKGIEKFIVPYTKYKIAKLHIDDIYIPKHF
jgi:hypothetical protein